MLFNSKKFVCDNSERIFLNKISFALGLSARNKAEPKYFSGSCQEPNGRYAVSDQCDKYVQCTDGVAEEKLCSDGLLYNDRAEIYTYPCQYPIDVNCTTRARLQPAIVRN